MTSRKSFHSSRSQTLFFSAGDKGDEKSVCSTQATEKWVHKIAGDMLLLELPVFSVLTKRLKLVILEFYYVE